MADYILTVIHEHLDDILIYKYIQLIPLTTARLHLRCLCLQAITFYTVKYSAAIRLHCTVPDTDPIAADIYLLTFSKNCLYPIRPIPYLIVRSTPAEGMYYGIPGWVYLIAQRQLRRSMHYGMPGWVWESEQTGDQNMGMV